MPRPGLIVVVALALLLGGCAAEPPPGPPPIEPYRGYFQSLRPEGVYLFETLANKQFFDADTNGDAGLTFEAFLSRTGERVFINVSPNGKIVIEGLVNGPTTRERPRVEQIARGYELLEETELFRFADPDAPPVPEAGEEAVDDPSTRPTTQPDA